METCAFIDVFTTMNDLYFGNNCPIQFRCELFDWSNPGEQRKIKQVNMVPDESILGNGISYHGYSDDIVKKLWQNQTPLDKNSMWDSLNIGLETIYGLIDSLSKNGVYIVGYGLDGYVMSVFNENFNRVLGKGPIYIRKDRKIDVEVLSKKTIEISRCGNYAKNSVLAALGKFEKGEFGFKTLKREIEKTETILRKIASMEGLSTLSDVSRFMAIPKPVEYFQMGKYKGMKIDDAFDKDRQYFSWIMKNREKFNEDADLLAKVSSLLESEKR